MSISMIGIDYNKANVDIRAMFSFTKKNATAAMERLKKIPGIQGCVILSTCNRMELWASTKADWNGTLLEELCKIKEVDPTQYGEYFVERNEEEAVSQSVSSDQRVKIHDSGGRSDHHTGQGCADAGERGLCDG